MSAKRRMQGIAGWAWLGLVAGAHGCRPGTPRPGVRTRPTYAARSITVLDEVTPLQERMKALVPEFEKETGIRWTTELLNHFEVISKGQADMLSAGAPTTP